MTTFFRVPSLDLEATEIETLAFLGEFLRYMQPELIVEAGTWRGHFASLAAQMCPESEIHTADVKHWDDDKPQHPNLHYHICDFEEMLPKLPKSVDFAFIDSGPVDFENIKEHEHFIRFRHWRACKKYLSRGGYMACHDMINDDWAGADVIKEESGLYLPAGRGLCIWQKPRY